MNQLILFWHRHKPLPFLWALLVWVQHRLGQSSWLTGPGQVQEGDSYPAKTLVSAARRSTFWSRGACSQVTAHIQHGVIYSSKSTKLKTGEKQGCKTIINIYDHVWNGLCVFTERGANLYELLPGGKRRHAVVRATFWVCYWDVEAVSGQTVSLCGENLFYPLPVGKSTHRCSFVRVLMESSPQGIVNTVLQGRAIINQAIKHLHWPKPAGLIQLPCAFLTPQLTRQA